MFGIFGGPSHYYDPYEYQLRKKRQQQLQQEKLRRMRRQQELERQRELALARELQRQKLQKEAMRRKRAQQERTYRRDPFDMFFGNKGNLWFDEPSEEECDEEIDMSGAFKSNNATESGIRNRNQDSPKRMEQEAGETKIKLSKPAKKQRVFSQEEKEEAAMKIQSQFRGWMVRKQNLLHGLRRLDELMKKLDQMVFLSKARALRVDHPIHLEKEVVSQDVLQFEDELTRLLLEVDQVRGGELVRDARKKAVKQVMRELDEVDAFKGGLKQRVKEWKEENEELGLMEVEERWMEEDGDYDELGLMEVEERMKGESWE